jgi:hypothetical protein
MKVHFPQVSLQNSILGIYILEGGGQVLGQQTGLWFIASSHGYYVAITANRSTLMITFKQLKITSMAS